MATQRKLTITDKRQYERQKWAGAPLETVSLKVPNYVRRHWQLEARLRDSSLSAIIAALLEKELGLGEAPPRGE